MRNTTLLKEFIKYVTFNVIGMIALSFYIFADTYFISKGLGAMGLAALNLSFPIYTLVSGIGLMIAIGGGSLFKIYSKKNNIKKSQRIFTDSIKFGLIIGFFLFLVGFLFSEKIIYFLGADKATFSYGNIYLKTIMMFSPFFILNNVLLAFTRNDGSPKISMFAMIIGSLSNVILDYIFILIFNWGMFGAAFATGLAPIISISILLFTSCRKSEFMHWTHEKTYFFRIIEICKIGLSSFVIEFSSGIVIVIFNIIILKQKGNIGVAAYSVVANLALIVNAIYTGIAQGIQPIVSKEYAIKNKYNIYTLLKYSFVLSTVLSIMLYISMNFYSDDIVKAFNKENNQELVLLITKGMQLYYIGFLFSGFNIVIAIIFSSIDNPNIGLLISAIRGIILMIPCVITLSFLFGINGVWLSFPLTELVTFMLVSYLIKKKIYL